MLLHDPCTKWFTEFVKKCMFQTAILGWSIRNFWLGVYPNQFQYKREQLIAGKRRKG